MILNFPNTCYTANNGLYLQCNINNNRHKTIFIMKLKHLSALFALTLSLAACGESDALVDA